MTLTRRPFPPLLEIQTSLVLSCPGFYVQIPVLPIPVSCVGILTAPLPCRPSPLSSSWSSNVGSVIRVCRFYGDNFVPGKTRYSIQVDGIGMRLVYSALPRLLGLPPLLTLRASGRWIWWLGIHSSLYALEPVDTAGPSVSEWTAPTSTFLTGVFFIGRFFCGK